MPNEFVQPNQSVALAAKTQPRILVAAVAAIQNLRLQ